MKTPSPILEFAEHLRAHIERPQVPRLPDSPLSPPLQEEDFNRLALELFELQLLHNSAYARYCRRRGAESISHWTDIPAIPITAFKELELTCLAPAQRSHEFHSSRTTGLNPSRHFHNADSLTLYEASLWSWFRAHCESGLAGHQLIFLTPPRSEAPHSSLVHMFETIHRHGGSATRSFVGHASSPSGAWILDIDALRQQLAPSLRSGQPVGLLGTAFHFVHLLEALAEGGEPVALPAGSWALETGGYKGRSRSLPKPRLYQEVTQWLGIPPDRIIGEYGMCELSSQAYDATVFPHPRRPVTASADRVFRFPDWARVRVLSTERRGLAEAGQVGLLGVWDLANAWAVLAVQTEDLGKLSGEGFVLAGRAVRAEPRGCSLQIE